MKILRVILAIVSLAGMNEIWSVRNANEWEFKNPPINGLIPYYEQNNEVWIVLKNYTYNNGQKGLSAVLEYDSRDMSDLKLNPWDHAQAFEQKLKSIGINQSVLTISSSTRGPVYPEFDFIKINPSDIPKLGNMKREDGTIEAVKFSDLYAAGECSVASNLLTLCSIAGKNVFFLTSFFKSFVNEKTLDRIQTELKIPPVPVKTQVPPKPVVIQPQPTPTSPQPVTQQFKGFVVNKPQFSTVQEWSKKNLSGLVPYYKLSSGEVKIVLGYNDPYGDKFGVSTALFETDKDMNTAARDEGYINYFGPISKAGSFNSNGARYDLYIVEVVDKSKLVPDNLSGTRVHEKLSDLSELGTIDASSPLILPVQGLGLLAPVFKNFAGALLASKDSFTRPPQPVPSPTQVPAPVVISPQPPVILSGNAVQAKLQELAVRLNDLSLKI